MGISRTLEAFAIVALNPAFPGGEEGPLGNQVAGWIKMGWAKLLFPF